MRQLSIALAAAASFLAAATADVSAAPLDGLAILHSLDSSSPVQQARLFCYNKATGRFLYWGPCHTSLPRVYCKNRYTGRFLYWGACRRW
jgi:hypothetical protein